MLTPINEQLLVSCKYMSNTGACIDSPLNAKRYPEPGLGL